MNLQQLSRLFVTVILFLACVVLVLLAQAQGEAEPNKCHTDWDFCNSGSEAENAYHWQLGWCVAAVERGAVSASVSACMGQEEGTVSYPRTSSSSSSSSAPAAADDNKCYTEWDFCNSGSEAENAYHWKLGWCTSAAERGTMSLSVDQCMGEGPTTGSPPPEETTEPANRCYFWDPINSVCLRWILTPYHWTATIPPGMMCTHREKSWPFHCMNHAPAFAWILDITATAQAGG